MAVPMVLEYLHGLSPVAPLLLPLGYIVPQGLPSARLAEPVPRRDMHRGPTLVTLFTAPRTGLKTNAYPIVR